MVNSGACRAPRSRLRKTRAKSTICSSPAASSFFRRIPARCGDSAARGAVGADQLGGKAMEMGLVARRDLEDGGLDLDEALAARTRPAARANAVAREQQRPAVARGGRGSQKGGGGHVEAGGFSGSMALSESAGDQRQNR